MKRKYANDIEETQEDARKKLKPNEHFTLCSTNPVTSTAFENLSEKDRKVVREHLALRAEVYRWNQVRSHLIDDFHVKKCVMKRKYFKAVNPEDHKPYRKILFHGRDWLGFFDCFPATFRLVLESLLYDELSLNARNTYDDASRVYYGHNEYDEVQDCFLVDKAKWSFSDTKTLNSCDQALLQEYKDGFLAFFDQVLERLEANSISGEYVTKMKKERKRLENIWIK